MQASMSWVRGRTFLAKSGSGHSVVMDAPVANGGEGNGPSPMELVLIGTGGCTAVDVVMILEKMRQEVTGCAVELDASRAEADPKVFTHITMRFRVTGKGLDRAAVERAVTLSAEKYCSASIMIGKTARFTREVVVEEG